VAEGPLVVFGPRSWTYDFGPEHPLTPLRFGPAVDLLRACGAEPGLAPEPATDDELQLCHDADYIAAVKRLSADPDARPTAGIGSFSDNPPFVGMHEASAAVAGGSLAAMAQMLRGEVEHAFHPGGGLHHAMRDRASGFCIYDDPALAIALARRAGLRVLYVDLDVHHGDGVQALHYGDPGVTTVSFHETGRSLFPGSGFLDEVGEGRAAGTVINVPLEPGTGEGPWLDAVRSILPGVAASFGPDILVSQHGCDTHAWDPLAHLRVTTTAMGEAARLVDALAHRFAAGRWLSTGGGGYDAYRVVPRAWSLVWLAGAHRGVPEVTPPAWRARWEAAAASFGTPGMPRRFEDPPNAGQEPDRLQIFGEEMSRAATDEARRQVLPALIRASIEAGWDPLAAPTTVRGAGIGGRGERSPSDPPPGDGRPAPVDGRPAPGDGRPSIVDLTNELVSRARLAEGTVPVASGSVGQTALAQLIAGPGFGVGAVSGHRLVGVAVARPGGDPVEVELVAIGVAPAWRRRGIGSALLDGLLARPEVGGRGVTAAVGPAERDVMDPWPFEERLAAARGLLGHAGFAASRADDRRSLPATIRFVRPA
jgi:acetoin utilization protein AcuC